MTFDVILEHSMTGAITLTTVANCKDMDECIDYIHDLHPDHTIEQIKRVANVT